MTKKVFDQDYYIGLDVGTSSVGWAVTDLSYHIPNFNGKAMWGSVLFEEAKTAAERRLHRCARRRTERRKYRIQLLQSLFAEEMAKVDFDFFMRLKSSNLWAEDKTVEGKFSYFNDKSYTDKEFYDEFKTIYHLRHKLATEKGPFDIRLVYLAIHHIIKHRGHFLLPGDFTSTKDIQVEPLIDELMDLLNSYLGVNFSISDMDEFKRILSNNEGTKNKKDAFKKVFTFGKEDKVVVEQAYTLLAKGTVKLDKLFLDESLKDAEKNSLAFNDVFAEEEDIYRAILEDRFEIVEKLKAIFDWGLLQNLLAGKESISEAKVEVYNTHSEGLKGLKEAIKTLCPSEYGRMFGKPQGNEANYSAYVGSYNSRGKSNKKEGSVNNCTDENFYKFALGLFKDKEELKSRFPKVEEGLTKGTLLPKQKIKNNGVLPYQIHKAELQAILDNAKEYLPFLNNKDESGLTIADKIISLLVFRIPYYVGPLNTYHGKHAWAVKKETANIPMTPWTFDSLINIEESAKKFILRMTNKCSYIPTEDVLPKSSILYSKFMVLNELNNLKINNEKLSVEVKQAIFEELFLKQKKVTLTNVLKFLVNIKGLLPKNTNKDVFTGIDGDFKSNMASYLDFKNAFGVDVLSEEEIALAESIILDITLFGDDQKLKKQRIKELLPDDYSQDTFKKISNLRYKGWGRLSRFFLKDIKSSIPGFEHPMSIINALYALPGNPNLMQLLSNDYEYIRSIEAITSEHISNQSLDEMLEDMYISPSVKRSIHQTMGIIEELHGIIGKEPKKIFIEMARGADGSGRKESRKSRLLELYKSCKKEAIDIYNELDAEDENRLRSDKVYLYYVQMGRCMYSGEPIDWHQFGNYDIDHIYPQSAVKDDSLNNKVLVKKNLNATKGDVFPLPESIRQNPEVQKLWRILYEKKMLSREKLERLQRKTPFTDGELEGFISRQIVETRQSTKALAQVLKNRFRNTEIVYVKAKNVSEFRQGVLDMPKVKAISEGVKKIVSEHVEQNVFLKCRAINNHHHAKDAYLNIVVGNVYNTKFTSNPINFIKENRNKAHRGYSLNAMYRYPVVRGQETAWIPSSLNDEMNSINLGSMEVIRKYMRRNNVIVVRRPNESKGNLFDLQLVKKGKGQISQKGNGPTKDKLKYGAYNSAKGAYFFLVEHGKENKRILTIENLLIMERSKDISNEKLVDLCIKKYGYLNPVIKAKKIRYNELLEINGFKAYLSGRSKDRLIIANANELIIDNQWGLYIKEVNKIAERYKKLKENEREKVISVKSCISRKDNSDLYDFFISKMESSVYGGIYNSKSYSEKVRMLKNNFEALSTIDQVLILNELLYLFSTSKKYPNLKNIGGSSEFAKLTISKHLDSTRKVKIIRQSKTGLFENIIETYKL